MGLILSGKARSYGERASVRVARWEERLQSPVVSKTPPGVQFGRADRRTPARTPRIQEAQSGRHGEANGLSPLIWGTNGNEGRELRCFAKALPHMDDRERSLLLAMASRMASRSKTP